MKAMNRYARQSTLSVVGAEGQARIGASRVLVVGCGALGSVQAELLARAGVGHLILVDRDLLELHNLQRQVLFCEADVGLPKALAAATRLRAVNSEIGIEPIVADFTPANAADLVKSVDLVVDGTDNFETRYLLNDACVREARPWVYGGVLGVHGTVMAIRPTEGPCLRCLLPEPPDATVMPTCETQGVLNTAVAWVAALQVTEALKTIVGVSAKSRLHSLDVWQGTVMAVDVPRSDACPCCVARRFEFLDAARGSSSKVFCGRNAVQITPEHSVKPDFQRLILRLGPLGRVTVHGHLLEFVVDSYRLVVFPDGRVLVMGTTDTAEARSLVARYIGS